MDVALNREENRCTVENSDHIVSGEQTNIGLNNKQPSKTYLESEMKEGFDCGVVDRSASMNGSAVNVGVDTDRCVNMSVDDSKEDSDFSDYGEENMRCQLANQALRARLFSSVSNPVTEKDSKLRVSVFDHKFIPKRLIAGNGLDNRKCVDNNNRNIKINNGLNINDHCSDIAHKRRAALPVLRATRRQNSENISKGSKAVNGDSMESPTDFRTQFDILLRNLIGDVGGMQVEPAQMGVSSGYESDYTQTRALDQTSVDKSDQNKENIVDKHNKMDYLTTSDTYPKLNQNSTSLKASQGFVSLPSFPTQSRDSTLERRIESSREAPCSNSSKMNKVEKEQNGFSYTQRHNYKLTKVTRSMYEIIHDLQSGEKGTADNKRRSRKGRRSVDGLCPESVNIIKPRGRLHSGILASTNNNEAQSGGTGNNPNVSGFTGSVVRCVRRPLGGDPSLRPIQRGESNNRLASNCAEKCDKVQNDLRNLLCGASEVTLSSEPNNDHLGAFNNLSTTTDSRDCFTGPVNGHNEAVLNHTESQINPDPNTLDTSRRPTLNEQFMNRPKPDDHVYETIPGDEKLYEEWKKLRATSKMPRIRRFTTVPDLPGTFVPKEPPALPERRYLNSNQQQPKETDNYIFMGDINSNFPQKESDSGYASVASDKMLDAKALQCYPYPIREENVFNTVGRSDEASDGYCSIDNMSLLREPIIPPPELSSRPWPNSQSNSIPRLPQKRHEYFFEPIQNRQARTGMGDFQTHFDRHNDFVHRDMQRLPRNNSDTSIGGVTPSFEPEAVRPVFQATYV